MACGCRNTPGRVVGLVGDQSGKDKPDVGPGFPQQQGPQFSDVKVDTYGFFHGALLLLLAFIEKVLRPLV